jgi:DamX protein
MSQPESFFQTLIDASQQAEHKSLLTLKTQAMMLERLEHFSLYSDRLVFISGESGSGRSTLLKLFQQRVPDTISAVRVDCTKQDWFFDVLTNCGLHSKAGQQSFQFGLSQIKSDKEVVLLLDNADELTIDQIELLAEKVKSDHFHCVLSVDQHSKNLQWGYEYPKRVVLLKAEPLAIDESRELLAFSINLPSSQLALLLPDDKLNALIKQSNGNPGTLVTQATELLEQSSQTRITKTSAHKPLVLMGYGLLALLLISVLIFQQEINQLIFSDEVSSSTAETTSSFDTNKIVKNTEQDNIEALTDEQLAESSSKDDVFALTPVIESTLDNTKASKAGDTKAEDSNKTEIEQFEQELLLEAESAQAELNNRIQQTGTELTTSDENKVQNKSESTVIENNQTSPLNDSVLNRTAENNSANDKSSKSIEAASNQQSVNNSVTSDAENINQKAEPEKAGDAYEAEIKSTEQVKEVSLVSGETKRSFSAEEAYLLSLDSSMWVIQLSGFSLLDNAADFMQQHFKSGELHFYRTLRDDKDWYVVIMGPFSDKAEATRQRAQLPDTLAKTQPWLKPMSSVKREIQVN